VADTTNTPFKTSEDTLGKQSIEDPDAGAGRSRLTGVPSEEATTKLGRGRIAMLVDESYDRPITFAQPRSNALDLLSTSASDSHNRILSLDRAGMDISGGTPQIVASPNEST
jgi:hypothetical protein